MPNAPLRVEPPTVPKRRRWQGRRVIPYRELPSTLPVWRVLTLGLLLDRLHMPGWVWGAVAMLCLGWLGLALLAMVTERAVSVLPPEREP